MPPKTIAHIAPDVLVWARESTGYSRRDAARKIGIDSLLLEAAETGNDLLTLREAETAADVYGRQLPDLFLPAPPEEEAQEMQFRRLPGAPDPPWTPEMQLLAREITERQLAAVEIYEALDERTPWSEQARLFTSVDKPRLAALTREVLGVGRREQRAWSAIYEPFNAWRAAIEALGILVMQDGSIDIEEDARGFASIAPAELPAIVVNNDDDPRARAFTLLHEFGHVLLAARGEGVGSDAEEWCNRFAGEVLLPPDWLAEDLETLDDPDAVRRAHEIARLYNVTPLAAAVRIARSGLVDRAEADHAIGALRRRGEDAEEVTRSGGDYYRNQVSWYGPSFIRLVFDAVDSQAVTLPTASALLGGVKVDNFSSLREMVESYG